MPAIHRTRATLRIMGDDLEPEEVSRLLGAQPSFAHRKGEWVLGRAKKRPAKSGMWQLEGSEMRPGDFNRQASDLLSQLTRDLQVWQQLGERYRVDLFCGWFMQGANEGEDISADLLLALGSRRIALGIDIYGPDDPEE